MLITLHSSHTTTMPQTGKENVGEVQHFTAHLSSGVYVCLLKISVQSFNFRAFSAVAMFSIRFGVLYISLQCICISMYIIIIPHKSMELSQCFKLKLYQGTICKICNFSLSSFINKLIKTESLSQISGPPSPSLISQNPAHPQHLRSSLKKL